MLHEPMDDFLNDCIEPETQQIIGKTPTTIKSQEREEMFKFAEIERPNYSTTHESEEGSETSKEKLQIVSILNENVELLSKAPEKDPGSLVCTKKFEDLEGKQSSEIKIQADVLSQKTPNIQPTASQLLTKNSKQMGDSEDKKEFSNWRVAKNIWDTCEKEWKLKNSSYQYKLIQKNNSIYEGEAKSENDILYSPSGKIQCEGEWLKDGRSGLGKYFYENGDIYEGSWWNNHKCGFGIMNYATGAKYEGEWSSDKKDGIGIQLYENGDIYSGNWQNDLKNGKGILQFSVGVIYEGFFESDRLHGKGKITWGDGAIYEGDMLNNMKHGIGTHYYASGDKYEGEFRDDKIDGRGKCTFKNGLIVEGLWKNNQEIKETEEIGYFQKFKNLIRCRRKASKVQNN